MVRLTIRLTEELHEKLRWLSFQSRRSQHEIMLEAIKAAVRDVEVPKEAKK